MRQENRRGIMLKRELEHDLRIGNGTGYTAAADQAFGKYFSRSVYAEDPEFLVIQISKTGPERMKNIAAAADLFGFGFFSGISPPPAHLQRSDNTDRLCLANAFEARQFLYRNFAKFVQAVPVLMQDALSKLHGRFMAAARADQDRDQLGIGKYAPALGQQLFSRPVALGPGFNAQFVGIQVHMRINLQSIRPENKKRDQAEKA